MQRVGDDSSLWKLLSQKEPDDEIITNNYIITNQKKIQNAF